jgi:hypothetical protein
MLERFWKNSACTPSLTKIFTLSNLPIPTSMDSLLSLTQKHFLRPKGKERFELKDTLRQFFHRKAFHKEFQTLGLIDPIYPHFKEYDSILILGTSYFDMVERIRFFLSLNVKANHIFFLTGKRPLAKKEPKSSPPFEDAMSKELAKKLLPPTIPYSFIVSKMNGQNRPTTKDTLLDWFEQTQSKGPTLLISNQPYGEYQRLVATSLSNIPFDLAAAPPCENKKSVSIYLDTIARILYLLEYTADDRKERKSY